MSKFIITIEEMRTQDFEIEAEEGWDAMEIAMNRYNNGELVLTQDKPQFRQIAVSEPSSEATEWMEF